MGSLLVAVARPLGTGEGRLEATGAPPPVPTGAEARPLPKTRVDRSRLRRTPHRHANGRRAGAVRPSASFPVSADPTPAVTGGAQPPTDGARPKGTNSGGVGGAAVGQRARTAAPTVSHAVVLAATGASSRVASTVFKRPDPGTGTTRPGTRPISLARVPFRGRPRGAPEGFLVQAPALNGASRRV